MVSHIGYLRKKEKLERILSQLAYTGEIPIRKKAKDELMAIRELIESVYKKRDIVKKIQFLNKKIDVTVNFDESHLKKILHFLQNQENVFNKLTKIEVSQGLGKEIDEQYKIKINDIKYDHNEIKDIDKATNDLKEIEKEIIPYLEKNEPKDIEIYKEPNFLYSYQKNHNTKMNKICKFLLNVDKPVTESQIEENVRFDKFTVQRMVYELFGKSLVIGVRGIENNGFTYYWTAELKLIHYAEELEALIQDEMKNEAKKLKILEEFNDSGINKF